MITNKLQNKLNKYKKKSNIYSGSYTFKNKADALIVIIRYDDCINYDGTLTTGEWGGDENQGLIAALNYYVYNYTKLH